MKWFRVTPRIVFDVIVVLFFVGLVAEASEFRSLAGYYPLTVGWLGVGLGILGVFVDMRHARREADALATGTAPSRRSRSFEYGDVDEEPGDLLTSLRFMGWFAGYAILIWGVGMVVASALFLAAFLHFETRASLLFVGVGTAAGTGVLLLLAEILNFRLPPGLLG